MAVCEYVRGFCWGWYEGGVCEYVRGSVGDGVRGEFVSM